jgi:hypothetical protein
MSRLSDLRYELRQVRDKIKRAKASVLRLKEKQYAAERRESELERLIEMEKRG